MVTTNSMPEEFPGFKPVMSQTVVIVPRQTWVQVAVTALDRSKSAMIPG